MLPFRSLSGVAVAAVACALSVTASPAEADSAHDAMADVAGLDGGSSTSAQAREMNAAIAKLAASAEKAAAEFAKNAWKLPVARGSYRLTGRFGQCSSLWSHCHTGLDFAAPTGTPILAVANGTIVHTAWAGAYGNRTIQRLEDGTELWYCHQDQYGAKPGQSVFGGQPIGFVGSTGNSTGPHMHLEVRPGGGDAVDPFQALAVKGETP